MPGLLKPFLLCVCAMDKICKYQLPVGFSWKVDKGQLKPNLLLWQMETFESVLIELKNNS